MKNKELFTLVNAIRIVGKYEGLKFAYAMARNLRKVETEIEIFNTILKPSKELTECEMKRIEICVKYADKENNQPKMVNNNYIIGDKNKKEFDKEITKLRKDYKKTLDRQTKNIEDYNKLMEEESDFIPYKVLIEDVPKEITGNELKGILELIEEDNKKKK